MRTLTRAELNGTLCTLRPRSPVATIITYFHGAISQTKVIKLFWSSVTFSREAKRAIAKRVLVLWQQGGTYRAADDYIHAIGMLACEWTDQDGEVVRPDDLPTN